ncbi:hypothetical protein X560_1231 [Listeria fleischmannii 1991]|uniref:Uncharacterized protein n=1 Tax=Listeria fleischmannii 1991 TaxID=1430899 RepID=A0A0J8GAD0_9LIST|nr:hypothetical protein X560_1231 [Listeria fleischmannii 1991]
MENLRDWDIIKKEPKIMRNPFVKMALLLDLGSFIFYLLATFFLSKLFLYI